MDGRGIHGEVGHDPESFYLGDRFIDAALAAKTAFPHRKSFVLRVGHDAAFHIGGSSPRESYLNISSVLKAEGEAVHPGYGFLSENSEFADAVLKAGRVWALCWRCWSCPPGAWCQRCGRPRRTAWLLWLP